MTWRLRHPFTRRMAMSTLSSSPTRRSLLATAAVASAFGLVSSASAQPTSAERNEGDANGAPHPDPSAYAKKFSGKYSHRNITGGIGHNLPQEAPQAFAEGVIEVAGT